MHPPPEPAPGGFAWSSTDGAASTPPSPPLRQSPVRRGAPGPWPCGAGPLYDRLRALAEYDYTRRPEATLILTSRFRVDLSLDDCYGAVESRDALERRDVRLWCQTSFVFGSSCHKLDFGSYLHHRPRVSARLSQRSL